MKVILPKPRFASVGERILAWAVIGAMFPAVLGVFPGILPRRTTVLMQGKPGSDRKIGTVRHAFAVIDDVDFRSVLHNLVKKTGFEHVVLSGQVGGCQSASLWRQLQLPRRVPALIIRELRNVR